MFWTSRKEINKVGKYGKIAVLTLVRRYKHQ